MKNRREEALGCYTKCPCHYHRKCIENNMKNVSTNVRAYMKYISAKSRTLKNLQQTRGNAVSVIETFTWTF